MRQDVLEEFAEANLWRHAATRRHFADRLLPQVESHRRAYRERHREAGCCLSCPRPCALDRHGRRLAYCVVHRSQARARALASLGCTPPST